MNWETAIFNWCILGLLGVFILHFKLREETRKRFLRKRRPVRIVVKDWLYKHYKLEFQEFKRPFLYGIIGKRRWLKVNECTMSFEEAQESYKTNSRWEVVIESEKYKKQAICKKYGI